MSDNTLWPIIDTVPYQTKFALETSVDRKRKRDTVACVPLAVIYIAL